MNQLGTLVFFCGKMASGKSTEAKKRAQALDAILLSEDEWLATIYPDEIKNFDDYLRYSRRLKPLLKAHVKKILLSGVSVVMDFPGNTEKQRAWFAEIIGSEAIPHMLVYLDMDDETCLGQLEQRRKSQPQRQHFDTEAVFKQVTQYFQPPTQAEGFQIEVVQRGNA